MPGKAKPQQRVVVRDTPTGRESTLQYRPGTPVGDLKRRMSAAFGYDADQEVILTRGGRPVAAADITAAGNTTAAKATSTTSAPRIDLTPSPQRYLLGLHDGSTRLANLPVWARRQRECALASDRFTPGSLDPALWGDKEVMRHALAHSHDVREFSRMPAALRGNRKIAEEAVTHDPERFWLLPEALRDDKMLSLALRAGLDFRRLDDAGCSPSDSRTLILNTNSDALAHAPAELRSSHDDMLQVAQEGLTALASRELLASKAFALEALQLDRRVLRHLHRDLRNDIEVCAAAIMNGAGLDCVPAALWHHAGLRPAMIHSVRDCCENIELLLPDDRELMMEALRGCQVCADDGHCLNLLDFAGPTLRGDKEVMLAALARCGDAICHATPELRADPEVLRAAMGSQNPAFHSLLAALPPSATSQRDLMLPLVEAWPTALRWASPELRADREVVLAGLNARVRIGTGTVYHMLPAALQGDREVTVAAMASGDITSHPLFADKEAVMRAIEKASPACVLDTSNVLFYATPEIRADREVVLHALSRDADYFAAADESLRDDPEVATAAVSVGISLSFVSSKARSDRRVVLAAIGEQANPANCNFIPPGLWDREVALRALGFTNGMFFAHLPDALRGDREVALAAVRCDPSNFAYASEALRGDMEVMSAAVEGPQRRGRHAVLFHAAASLQEDRDAVVHAVRCNQHNMAYAHPSLQASVAEELGIQMGNLPEWGSSPVDEYSDDDSSSD